MLSYSKTKNLTNDTITINDALSLPDPITVPTTNRGQVFFGLSAKHGRVSAALWVRENEKRQQVGWRFKDGTSVIFRDPGRVWPKG